MSPLAFVVSLLALSSTATTLQERIDLFDAGSGAHLGWEQTWWGPDGRRLRLEIVDAEGDPTLLFFIRHDGQGREIEAIYFDEGSTSPYREVFTYSDDGRLMTTNYSSEPGAPGEKTESDLDASGREIDKRYYRSDGSQYGREETLWNDDGTRRGWDFGYVDGTAGAAFRYEYHEFDDDHEWIRRTRSRDGKPERTEARSRITAATQEMPLRVVRFAPDRVSTDRSESSPSFSTDGKTMVFARYAEEWTRKEPFIAYLEEGGWRVQRLESIGEVYNLAISPDANTVIYSKYVDSAPTLHRIRRVDAAWSKPEDLTDRYKLSGSYPCLTVEGDLYFSSAEGTAGVGIYSASRNDDGFDAGVAVYVPGVGTSFDAYISEAGSPMLVTRCLDESCESGPENGIWEITLARNRATDARKLERLPYAWGVQPVAALGLMIFTDGQDILAIPMAALRERP